MTVISLFQLQFYIGNLQTFTDWFVQKIIQNSSQPLCLLPTSMNDIVQQHKDPAIKHFLEKIDIFTPDGMPLVWMARFKGLKEARRIYGPELMEEIFYQSQTSQLKHFFYGSDEPTLQQLILNMQSKYPGLKIVGSYAPPFRELTAREKMQVIEKINQSQADIVWVGLGGKKQIQWVAEMKDHLQVKALLAVGAAFDFLSGTKPQAPRFMRNIGFEWFFRLVSEPQRLWRRYLLQIPVFVVLFVKELKKKTNIREVL